MLALAVASSRALLDSPSAHADPGPWLPIPAQDWMVGTPVHLDLADYCTDDSVDPATFALDQPLPPGLTLQGGVISGVPTAISAVSNYVASVDVVGSVTGVPDGGAPAAKPSLVAFPNPAAGAVMFSGERRSSDEAGGVMRVFSVSGRMVYEREIHVLGTRYELSWDGRTRDGNRLASGVYVVTVRTGSEMARTRLIVTQ
ncbi:MAG: T9SS type A sorting domain-containing protein [Candidatus Eiseniibacteriota bacterium]